MNYLKMIFPFAFKDTKTTNGLVVSLVLHIVLGAVVTIVGALLVGLFSGIPVLGTILAFFFRLIYLLVDLYAVIGIFLALLCRAGVV